MPSGGDQSPPPPPPPPAAAASDEEEEDDGEAEDAAQPSRSPAPQTQQRFDELCSLSFLGYLYLLCFLPGMLLPQVTVHLLFLIIQLSGQMPPP